MRVPGFDRSPTERGDVAAAGAAAVLDGVGVRHEGATAWTPDGVDLAVAPSEVLLVLGPSGCGKSTLALTLNGLVPHAVPAELHGSVMVGGRSARDATVAELSEHAAMVFQDPDAQLVTRTVLDEVCFGPENRLVPAAEIEVRAEAALRAVGLWERRHDDPDILSGGAKQRLAIACALALESPLLVLDEPTSNIDPAGADEVYRVLGALTGPGSARSVVLIEHDVDRALGVADTVLVLDGAGRPFARGPVREVLRERAEELAALGVWLPAPTAAALRLRRAGVRLDPLPLTPEELTDALAAAGAVPAGVRAEAAPGAEVGRPSVGAPVAAAPVVAVDRLTVERGGRRILDDVSLRVEPGEFLAVVGPNGAGKTTLIQAIAGLRRAPRGRVAVGGADPARRRRATEGQEIGFVFQNPEHQFVATTVEDELSVGLRRRRLPAAEVQERVDRILTVLDLDAQRASHPFLLSGGQKRRLSVGTALIAGASVLVLDEPTYGQDRARADELLGLLARLNAEGTTVIVVTHDLGLIGDYATRIAIVDDGRLAAVDATSRILADRSLLEAHGLRQPPLARALAAAAVPEALRGITRLADLPGS
ncbi:ABC transporter ATP-binding protein [Leifsonia shinshuensis]|uniref:ABC transporter ATP-binding protein n=1 Tax=Leifsonia shinshuensis TaxID=150026 RepID=UPI0028602BE7|nr:ABC transporter ATP-binding protein [Leifsonia shinshuensis]MDR6972052.1 energy-coupling factor transport system ATP-binding protein [Leifsonia shinshuensis]